MLLSKAVRLTAHVFMAHTHFPPLILCISSFTVCFVVFKCGTGSEINKGFRQIALEISEIALEISTN